MNRCAWCDGFSPVHRFCSWRCARAAAFDRCEEFDRDRERDDE
jgi:hypothetical protein